MDKIADSDTVNLTPVKEIIIEITWEGFSHSEINPPSIKYSNGCEKDERDWVIYSRAKKY